MNEAAGRQSESGSPLDTSAVMSVLAAIGKVPLVGREAECALIDARLADATNAPGGVIVISGEPGVGKTRLAQATAAGSGRTVVNLRCDEHLRDVPYSPFLNHIDGLGDLSSLLTFPASPAESAATRLDMFEQVHRLLMQHAGEHLCVLVVDQLEWIDAASLDLLRHLVRRSQGGGFILLATMRIGAPLVDEALGHLLAEWNRERLLLDIPLGPIGRPESAELVIRLLGQVDDEVPEVVYARTDGLPFFIEEYVRQLVTEGNASYTGGVWYSDDLAVRGNGSMPFGIAAGIMRRLDYLPAPTSEALRIASVLGTRCSLSLLASLAGCLEDELIEDLAPAVAMRLFQIESNGVHTKPTHGSFTHALVRDGLYAAMPREERREIHGRAAAMLAQSAAMRSFKLSAGTDAALVAYHAERAHAWMLAYEAALAAGDAAVSILAGQDALAHFNRARGFVHAGHVTSDAATELALDYRLVATLRGIGHLEESANAAREMAVRASEAGDRAAEAWALIQIAGADTFSDRFNDVDTVLQQGSSIVDSLDDEGLLATALATRGVLSSARGRLDEADQDFQRAIPLAEQAGNRKIALMGMTYVGLTASWRGQYREAIARCEEAVHMAESLHDAAALADARFSLALSLGGCGEYEDALVTLQQLLDLAKTSGEPYYAARVPNTVGWIYREMGLVEQALPWDERACTEPDDYGGICHFKATANSLINLGMDLIILGKPDQAEDALKRAENAVNQSDYLRWRSDNRLTLAWGELALARGDASHALDLAADALAQATATDSAKHAHQAHDLAGRALAALGRYTEATARFEHAIAISGEIEYVAGHWRALSHLADSLIRQRNTDLARERVVEARNVVHAIAARLRNPELRRDFLAAPEVAALLAPGEPGTSASQAYPMGLSEREVEVLRLVTEGLTNTQIAARLYISPKTVSSHLVSVFGKLGVTSRASATRFALEHGLV